MSRQRANSPFPPPGITGQDGSYLTELLLEKGYEVHGMCVILASLSPSLPAYSRRFRVEEDTRRGRSRSLPRLLLVSFIQDDVLTSCALTAFVVRPPSTLVALSTFTRMFTSVSRAFFSSRASFRRLPCSYPVINPPDTLLNRLAGPKMVLHYGGAFPFSSSQRLSLTHLVFFSRFYRLDRYHQPRLHHRHRSAFRDLQLGRSIPRQGFLRHG
jgi:hypothetical protein